MKRLTLVIALLFGFSHLGQCEMLDKGKGVGHHIKKKQKIVKQQHHLHQQAQSLDQTSQRDFKVKSLKDFHDETRPEDEGRILEIFYNNYDHLDHGVHEISQDVSRIKVLDEKTRRKKGRKCQPLDWVTAHFKTFADTGHKLEDSRVYKSKQPTVFQIGMYNSLKCWEISASYMHAGQMLKIKCPSYLAYGGTPHYGHFENDLIPANSELIFELDILECQPDVEKINKVNKKAKNNAPIVYKGFKWRDAPEEPAVAKKDLKVVKSKVKDLRKNVVKQKKKISQEKLKTQDIEKNITQSESVDMEEEAGKMMAKEEKIIKEQKIVEKEKTNIKKAKKLIKKAENPKKAAEEEEQKKEAKEKEEVEKKENPKDIPAKKAANETKNDVAGKPLTPNPPAFECFFIMYPQKDAKGQNLVLEIDHKDKYAPKKTGIYNVRFHPFEGNMDEDDEDNHVKAQQWTYDPVEHKLITKAYPNKVLFQGNNRNLVVYDNKSMKNQYFNFDAQNGIWYNEYTLEGVMVDPAAEVEVGANVITGKKNVGKNLERMSWKMVPCGQGPKVEGGGHHGGGGHHDEDEGEEEEGEHHEEGGEGEEHHEDGDEEEEKEKSTENKKKKIKTKNGHDHDIKEEADSDEEKAEQAQEEKEEKEEEDHHASGDEEDKDDEDEKKDEKDADDEPESQESQDLKKAQSIVKGIIKKKKEEEAEAKKPKEPAPKPKPKKKHEHVQKKEEKSESESSKTSSSKEEEETSNKSDSEPKEEEPEKPSAKEEPKEDKPEKVKDEDEKSSDTEEKPAKSDDSGESESLAQSSKKKTSLHQTKSKSKKSKKSKKTKSTSTKKSKSKKKHSKKKQIAVQKESDAATDSDDIMEKFEETMGKMDLEGFESLHQKEPTDKQNAIQNKKKKSQKDRKNVSGKLSDESQPSRQLQSADSDQFDHEKKQLVLDKQQKAKKKNVVAATGKPQHQEQKQIKNAQSNAAPAASSALKASQQSAPPVDEEDRVLEKKIGELKQLLKE